jgi:long-chain fatty acid transport protein
MPHLLTRVQARIPTERVFWQGLTTMMLAWVRAITLRAGWLLTGLSALAAHADVGPALSGLSARATDASTVYWSPAGITRLDQPELMVQAILVGAESKFEVDQSNVNGGNADNDTKFLLIPAFYYAHPINDRWSVGTSLTVPSGFGNEYGKTWSGRYLSEESDLAFVSLAGTVGYKLTDQWSIGGGPVVMYTSSTSKARVNNVVRDDGRVKLEEDGFGFGWQLGLMYEISDTARIGAVYRSEIDPDLSGKPKFDNIDPLLEDGLNRLGLLDQHIDVDFKVPAQGQLGYYQAFMDDWSFTVDALWINMSAFGINHVSVGTDHVSLSGEFKDVWLFSAGLKYQYRPELAFSVGAMHMPSPATNSRRTLALPLDRVNVIGAGVEWHWKNLLIHTNLNYADFGDGNLDQDGGLAGRVKGSFDTNHAIILDTQIIKRF